MVITRKLVFINFPKTGSSFVRKVLDATFKPKAHRRTSVGRISDSLAKRLPDAGPWGGMHAACEYTSLYASRYRVLECYNPVRGYLDQHGKVHQVPKQLLIRRFLSVARDPLSRFCSYYHFFKTVKEERFLPLLQQVIKASGTPLSQISTEKFYDMLFWRHNVIWMPSADLQDGIGPQTLDFLNHFAIDPIEAFNRVRDGAGFDDVRDLLPADFTLLNYQKLSSQLRTVLIEAGEPTFPASHPIWAERVLPDGVGGNFTKSSAKDMLSPALVERIERDEWFLHEAYDKLMAA